MYYSAVGRSEIRARRLERGWTQADLAARVGVSQPMISSIEQGRRSPGPDLETRLEAVLAANVPGAGSTAAKTRDRPPLPLEGPSPHELPQGHPLSISATSWVRPEQGGDGHAVIPLRDEAWLIAAIDVAGHGRRLYPKLQYVLGWLRGWANAQASVPSVHSVARRLEEELAASRIEAGWYLALIQAARAGSNEVLFGAVSSSYPEPLLFEGAMARSVPSSGRWEIDAKGHSLSLVGLEPPWRLLICSDGLLARLGGGQESGGLRRLRRWLRGADRDRPLAETLATDQAVVDDESALLIEPGDNGTEISFDVGDAAERHRAIRWIELAARNRIGEARAPCIGQAVLEALTNARDHAYEGSGLVTLRVFAGTSSFVVEVRDAGRDRVGSHVVSNSDGGFRIMRGVAASVDVWKNHPQGTVVTLTFERDPDELETSR